MKKCKMKKIILLMILLVLPTALAETICEDRLDNGSNCLMISPEIVCADYTYEIFLRNSTPVAQNQNLTLFNGSIYYLNFTQETGDYVIRLCDGTTTSFRVTETFDKKFDEEEKARMYISIVLMIGIFAAIFVSLAIFIKSTPFRLMFIGLTIGVMIIGSSMILMFSQAANLSPEIISILGTLYKVTIQITKFLFYITFIYGLYKLFSGIKWSSGNNRRDKDEL